MRKGKVKEGKNRREQKRYNEKLKKRKGEKKGKG